jgi:hypothetical protein
VHSSLVVSEAGTPLGVVAQEVWARADHPEHPEDWRYRVPLEAKESRKWLTGLHQSHERLGPEVAVVTVADREADVFELFALATVLQRDWVIRARHDRVGAEEPGRLVAAVEAAAAGGAATVTVSCAKGQHTRPAHTQVRWVQWPASAVSSDGATTVSPGSPRCGAGCYVCMISRPRTRQAWAPSPLLPISQLVYNDEPLTRREKETSRGASAAAILSREG